MRRTAAALASVGLVSLGVATPTLAAEGPPPPRHGHALVLGLVLDAHGEPVGYRRCIHLAAGRPLPLGSHHAHAHTHTGRAGEALFNAGHAVVPLAPLSDLADCDAVAEYVYGSGSRTGPATPSQLAAGVTSLPVDRLRYAKTANTWTLYGRGANLQFHRYDRLPASAHVDDLLIDIDRDPTSPF